MKSLLTVLAASALAVSLFAADADPRADVKAATTKLSATSYTWKSSVAVEGLQGGGRFRPGTTEGKIGADGLTVLNMKRGEETFEVVLKKGKGAIKTPDGWKTLSDAAEDDGGGQFTPTRFIAIVLQNYRTPAAEAEQLASQAKDLKADGETLKGELTEEGAKQFLTFRRPGGDGPGVSDAKGSVQLWLKDGVLSKYQYHIQGKVSFNGNDREIDRTTTIEIKDVGKTQPEAPADALKKLS